MGSPTGSASDLEDALRAPHLVIFSHVVISSARCERALGVMVMTSYHRDHDVLLIMIIL